MASHRTAELDGGLLGDPVFPPVYPAAPLPIRDCRGSDCPFADDGVRADTKAQQTGITPEERRPTRANNERGATRRTTASNSKRVSTARSPSRNPRSICGSLSTARLAGWRTSIRRTDDGRRGRRDRGGDDGCSHADRARLSRLTPRRARHASASRRSGEPAMRTAAEWPRCACSSAPSTSARARNGRIAVTAMAGYEQALASVSRQRRPSRDRQGAARRRRRARRARLRRD